MSTRWRNILLVISFVASCGVHAWLIVPGLLNAMESRPDETRSIPASYESPPVIERLDETPLGIDAPTDPSTFTWVGHEQYEEHLAQQSEVEQAAFSSDAGNPGMPVQPTPPVADPTEPSAQPAEPTEAQQAPEEEPQPEEDPQPEEEQVPEEEAPEEQVPESLSPLKPGGDVVAAAQTMFEDIIRYGTESAKQTTPTSPKPPEEAPKPAEKPKPTEQPKPKPAEKPKPPAPQPSPDTPQTTPGTPDSTPGERAEKDSEATSTIDVPLDDIKLGRPVARPGLEIKPRRPKFTTLTSLTASPRNPLVEIRFGRNGRPSLCRFVESTGDSRIDGPLQASLYEWRARGKQIDELEGEKTVNIQIRILLTRRRSK